MKYELPAPLPPNWKEGPPWGDGRTFHSNSPSLLVICDIAQKADGKFWLHVSFSRKNKIPSYQDCLLVKKLFVGKDRAALQIFPTENKHINIHPYCLHLWSCLDQNPIPDFTFGTNSI